jgi:hypothetical protein
MKGKRRKGLFTGESTIDLFGFVPDPEHVGVLRCDTGCGPSDGIHTEPDGR